ncbi:hypothetical protein MTO96_005756 [Rhipicephalus appendiculatus]
MVGTVPADADHRTERRQRHSSSAVMRQDFLLGHFVHHNAAHCAESDTTRGAVPLPHRPGVRRHRRLVVRNLARRRHSSLVPYARRSN